MYLRRIIVSIESHRTEVWLSEHYTLKWLPRLVATRIGEALIVTWPSQPADRGTGRLGFILSAAVVAFQLELQDHDIQAFEFRNTEQTQGSIART